VDQECDICFYPQPSSRDVGYCSWSRNARICYRRNVL